MTRVAGLVSVRNQERWIEAAVRTLAAESDEVVVVDDASDDGTTAILASLARELGIRVIRHDRAHGVSVSYNEAAAATDADVLLIQGGDDRTLPGRRDATVAALAEPDVVLVDSLPVVIDATDQVLPSDVAGEFTGPAADADPLVRLFAVGNFVCAPAAGVRRADYLAHGGFPAHIDLLQDYALWLRMLETGRLARVAEPLVEYRKHATNQSREQSGVDTPRLRRHAAEWDWIRNSFVDRASVATLERLGPIPGRPGDALDRDEAALLFRLASGDRGLTRRGLADLFTLLEGEPYALERLGLDRAVLEELSARADHDGAAEFGRGAAVARRTSA